MIVDASAVVAIVMDEPAGASHLKAMVEAEEPRISAVTLYEAAVVLLRRGGRMALEDMKDLLAATGVQTEPFGEDDAWHALESYARFGKGFSRAGLNFGDCPVHALAEKRNEPVLSTSDEFVRAGVQSAT